MSIRYDKETDTIRISLGHAKGEFYELEAGNFAVYIDDDDQLAEIVIQEASRFATQLLAAGIEVKEVKDATTPGSKTKPAWEDVDSSMISAFKYDESARILEVAFQRTGVYQYFDVPPDVVKGLRKASSKGSYMRSMIIDNYSYKKGR